MCPLGDFLVSDPGTHFDLQLFFDKLIVSKARYPDFVGYPSLDMLAVPLTGPGAIFSRLPLVNDLQSTSKKNLRCSEVRSKEKDKLRF